MNGDICQDSYMGCQVHETGKSTIDLLHYISKCSQLCFIIRLTLIPVFICYTRPIKGMTNLTGAIIHTLDLLV